MRLLLLLRPHCLDSFCLTRMSHPHILKKFVRFSSVGLTVFLAQEAFLWAFHHWTEWGPRVSFWAAWVPAVTLHFLLTKFFAFRNKEDAGPQILRYCGATTITTLIQYGIYHVALKVITPQPNIALVVAAALGCAINFLIMKWGVFEPKTSPLASVP